MYKLCTRMLVQRTPARSFHEASEYASIAAEEVWLLYPFVMYYMRSALVNSSIPGEAKAAYELCIHDYQEADATMDRTRRKLDRVLKGLSERCGLDLNNEYRAALRSVGACRDRLAKLSNSPLLDDNNEDIYNRTMVAYMLGKLIGIKQWCSDCICRYVKRQGTDFGGSPISFGIAIPPGYGSAQP
ncbi:hypothetical protein HU200_053757 [Digitaria exilis]|uniref:Uncharacterized protein n=1 Tax=Digitaria exilis TaxID=1010633 RepID=A0A835AM41_9POAL|nr:hypothetical protein HU200_053757 [Digitaria exilis]